MAVCNLATLQAQACANGFFGLSAKDARAIELQFWHYLSKNTLTVAQLKAQACANGFSSVDQKDFRAIELQLLCNIYGGESSGSGGCTNLIPDGAAYDVFGRYYLRGVDPITLVNSTIIQYGGTYLLTWGNNDHLYYDESNPPNVFSPGVGRTTQFTYNGAGGDLGFYFRFGIAGLPVTATLYSVASGLPLTIRISQGQPSSNAIQIYTSVLGKQDYRYGTDFTLVAADIGVTNFATPNLDLPFVFPPNSYPQQN